MQQQSMRVRFWFPDTFALESGQTARHVEIDMAALPREGEVVTFDDLLPDDVFRVVSVWWSMGAVQLDSGEADRGETPEGDDPDLRGQVMEVAVHLDLDAELTAALKDVETVEAGPRLSGNVISLAGKRGGGQ